MDSGKYHFKPIDNYVVDMDHGPLAPRVASLFAADTEYVVLDLDRTVHLDVTIGEQLGWEICGNPRADGLDPDCGGQGSGGMPGVSLARPLRAAGTLGRGLRYWGPAGLVYALTVRLGGKWPRWHKLMMSRLGASYVERMQALMRSVLMATAAGYTPDELRAYAACAWARWRSKLVIDADVVAAIREHCPRLRAVVLCSASTVPTVEHACGELGADGYISSSVDLRTGPNGHEEYCAPVGIPLLFRPRRPRYFSRPGGVVHNAAETKIRLLRQHYPQMFRPGTVTVGVSDNNHGEDNCWPNHFSHVIALNSRYPFSPLVAVNSVCMDIRIVRAATVVSEPLAAPTASMGARVYNAAEQLTRMVRPDLERLELLVRELRLARERASSRVDENSRRAMALCVARLADLVDRYNVASQAGKAALSIELDRLSSRLRRLRKSMSKAARDSYRIEYEIDRLHGRLAARLSGGLEPAVV
ncbi:MAG: hypothetical protein ACE5D3_01035 [Candidatus Binatia bacterium]